MKIRKEESLDKVLTYLAQESGEVEVSFGPVANWVRWVAHCATVGVHFGVDLCWAVVPQMASSSCAGEVWL